MAINIGMISLGCPKNQVDTENMLYILEKEGINICKTADESDVIIINTCGFIESAKAEAIESILEMAKLKKEGTIKKIIVTGCLSQRYKDELFSEIPEIDGILGTGSYDKIAKAVKDVMNEEKVNIFDDINTYIPPYERVLSTPPYMAYLKIAEGCDNRCTYCAIPDIRGKFRSFKMEDIIAHAKKLAKDGVKELYVIAQDTTKYGIDIYGEYKLDVLLKELCSIEGIKWVRPLYLYPDKITDSLIETFKSEEKLVNYIEMPLQHISNNVLTKMNRRGTKEEIINIIEKLRKNIKDVIIRTTFIVGFPGETKEDFEELLYFIKDFKLDRVGVFPYSKEEGTPAFDFKDQIEDEVKEKRAEILMEQQAVISNDKNLTKIGNTYEVIVEGYDEYAEVFYGRSYMDAFEIDGKIFFKSKNPLKLGEIVNVEIDEVFEYDLMGNVKE